MEDEKTKISMLQYKAFCNSQAIKIREMTAEDVQQELFRLDQTLQEFKAYYQETYRKLSDMRKKSSAELRELLRERDKEYVKAPEKEDNAKTDLNKKQESAIAAMIKLGVSKEKAYDMVVNVMLKK